MVTYVLANFATYVWLKIVFVLSCLDPLDLDKEFDLDLFSNEIYYIKFNS